MAIYFSFLIPIFILASIFLFSKTKIIWPQALLILFLPLPLILGGRWIGERYATSATEYWGSYVARAMYYEDWDEEVSCRHPIYCESCTGTGKDRSCSQYVCGYQHPYDVDYHPEYWTVQTSEPSEVVVDGGRYNKLCKQFDSARIFHNLNRHYHSKNGNAFSCDWKKEPDKIEAAASEHSYENRVRASNSIFRYPEVSPEHAKALGLFDYLPVNQGYKQEVLYGDISGREAAEKKFAYINGMLGGNKQVRVFVLVFRDKPLQIALDQQAYWQNGNKNELVIAIGVSGDYHVDWCFPFSWTEAEAVKVDTREFVMSQQKLDLAAVGDFLYGELDQKWKRKQFSDFKYLAVETPIWISVLAIIIIAAIEIGVSLFILKVQRESYDKENFRIQFGRRDPFDHHYHRR